MADIKSIDVSSQLLAVSTSTLIHLFPFKLHNDQGSISIFMDKRQTIKVDPIKSIKIRSFWYSQISLF